MEMICDEYIKLLNSYLTGSIDAKTFQLEYLEKFKNETRPLDDKLYNILDELFAEADAFCSDSILLSQLKKTEIGQYIDEQEFYELTKKTLELLKKLPKAL